MREPNPAALTIEVHREPLAVCRLDPHDAIPSWAVAAPFFSVSRTTDELSIVCASDRVPEEITANRGWVALKLRGVFDMSLVGLLLAVARPLAAAGVSIMPLATYDTDYVLVQVKQLDDALAALRIAGHHVDDTIPPG